MRAVRLRIAQALAIAATAATAGFAIAGRDALSVAGLAVLLGGALLLMLDLRARTGDIAHMQRLAARRHASARELISRVDRRTLETRTALRRVAGSAAAAGASIDYMRTMERRYLSAFETERMRAGDRHAELLAVLTGLQEGAGGSPESLERLAERVRKVRVAVIDEAQKAQTALARDVGALLQLNSRVSGQVLRPATGGYALDPRSLAHLLDVVDQNQPRVILELGSGSSTVWLAHLVNGRGVRFVSIDHDPVYAERTRGELERHGLADVVDLRLAPLAPVGIHPAGGAEDADRQWYDVSAMNDVVDIDLLIVDGPPKATGPLSRWPAFPILSDRLAPQALVVLDDSHRVEEQQAIELWRAADPLLQVEDEGVSRLTVLRRQPG